MTFPIISAYICNARIIEYYVPRNQLDFGTFLTQEWRLNISTEDNIKSKDYKVQASGLNTTSINRLQKVSYNISHHICLVHKLLYHKKHAIFQHSQTNFWSNIPSMMREEHRKDYIDSYIGILMQAKKIWLLRSVT